MGDGCTNCFCMGGQPMCMSPVCSLSPCKAGMRHVNVKGICCPVCEDTAICEMENGRKFIEGNKWQKDDCEVCHCTSSGITCEAPVYDENVCSGPFVKLSQKCPKLCVNGEMFVCYRTLKSQKKLPFFGCYRYWGVFYVHITFNIK